MSRVPGLQGKRFHNLLSAEEKAELAAKRARIEEEHRLRLQRITRTKKEGMLSRRDNRYREGAQHGKYPERYFAWSELRVLWRKNPVRYIKRFGDERFSLQRAYGHILRQLNKRLEAVNLSLDTKVAELPSYEGGMKKIHDGLKERGITIESPSKRPGRRSRAAAEHGRYQTSIKATPLLLRGMSPKKRDELVDTWHRLLLFALDAREAIWNVGYMHRYYRGAFNTTYRNNMLTTARERKSMDLIREYSEHFDNGIPSDMEQLWHALSQKAPKRAKEMLQKPFVPHEAGEQPEDIWER